MVQANGIDLSLFQFDYGMTWAVVFLNADGTIYGRYGTRDYRDEQSAKPLVALSGFRQALQAALEIHKGYPANKESLKAKRGPAPRFPKPDGYPSLRQFAAPIQTTSADTAETSCLHCHQIEQADYKIYRLARQPIPDDKLWAYPLPDVAGIVLDPAERARVKEVLPNTPGAKAGFKAGDDLVSLDGQPLVSIADVQWVLHQAKDPATVKAEVSRGGSKQSLTLSLPAGWRRKGAVKGHGSWVYRPISDARDLPADQRKKLGLADSAVAIEILWADHGLQKGDVIIEADGRRSGMTLTDFLAYTAQKKMTGDKVAVTVLRGGKELKIQLAVP